MSDEDDKKEKSGDLTRIEDLSEYLHELDPETEAILESEATDSKNDDLSLDIGEDLEDSFEQEGEEENFEQEIEEEENFGQEDEDANFGQASTDPSFSMDDFTSDEDQENTLEDPDDDNDQQETNFSDDLEDGLSSDYQDTQNSDLSEDSYPESEPGPQLESEQTDTFIETEQLPPTPTPPEPEDIFENSEALQSPSQTAIKTHSREDFQDLRDFGNSISYGVVATGGNPPFTLMVKGIRYEEDAETILSLLKEHGLCADESSENILKQSLQHGNLLISQISEYSAIYLAHRLRRFDCDIQVGLSDELSPSKSYQQVARGLISKGNLTQNIKEEVTLKDTGLSHESMILTTTPTIENYTIQQYLQVLSSHTLISHSELEFLHSTQLQGNEKNSVLTESEERLQKELQEELKDTNQEELEMLSFGLNKIYKDLAIDLKNQAFKLEANALIGINYQITPLITEDSSQLGPSYKITCTGNAVNITKA